ncbi:MAG: putative rane protein [Candidatus Midichloriaceae bacterium]|jgi:uncharacterized RDD family membrane protein YckC|nr:putative rane protein [Candidatus Midichloriaceae bacterium]
MQEKGQVVEYASLHRRIVAASIDLLIMILVLAPIMGFIADVVFAGRSSDILINELSLEVPAGEIITGEMIFVKLWENDFFKNYLIVQLISFIMIGAYIITFWFFYSTTPGKWMCACKVVTAKNLEKPSLLRLIVRFLGYVISAVPFGFGFIMVAFSANKQGLHDKIAGTAVINFKHDFTKFNELRNRLLNRS